MNQLPDEIIEHIASFLGQYERYHFSISSKYLYNLLYDSKILYSIKSWKNDLMNAHKKMFNVITRINDTYGVIYGECLQCGQLKLLYTQNDDDYTICLENCKLYCFHCDKHVYVHHINKGCPACFNNVFMRYY